MATNSTVNQITDKAVEIAKNIGSEAQELIQNLSKKYHVSPTTAKNIAIARLQMLDAIGDICADIAPEGFDPNDNG